MLFNTGSLPGGPQRRGDSKATTVNAPAESRRLWALAVVPVLAIGVVFQLGITGAATASTSPGSVAPNHTNEADCNGWSAASTSVKPGLRAVCTDPIKISNGKASRFIDNGWYVGHDAGPERPDSLPDRQRSQQPAVRVLGRAQYTTTIDASDLREFFRPLRADPALARPRPALGE